MSPATFLLTEPILGMPSGPMSTIAGLEESVEFCGQSCKIYSRLGFPTGEKSPSADRQPLPFDAESGQDTTLSVKLRRVPCLSKIHEHHVTATADRKQRRVQAVLTCMIPNRGAWSKLPLAFVRALCRGHGCIP